MSVNGKHVLFAVVPLALLFCAAMVLGFGDNQPAKDKPFEKPAAALKAPLVESRPVVSVSRASMAQSGAQFDLSRGLIAGGGGTSSGGSFTLDSIVGQPAAGTIMSGGNFVLAGGFSYAITSGSLPSPTPSPTPTANFIVNSVDDSVDANPSDGICETALGNGVCTLRAAIQQASTGNTISFDLPASSIIKLTSGELLINKNLKISGPGANLLTVQRSTATPFRIFDIASGAVTLSGFTISGGVSPDNRGGGIYDSSTEMVTVSNVTISGNSAGQGEGGGINIESTGTLNVTSSIISGNSADSGGGGISNVRGVVNVTGSSISHNFAHGILNEVSNSAATVTVTNSTITGNSVSNQVRGGAGISNAILTNTGTITVTVVNSTISGNSAGNSGGGIQNFIFGSLRSGPTITMNVLNSTISGNSAGGGGGILISSDNQVTVNITGSTISANSAVSGGGIANSGSGGVVNVRNSIIAKNAGTTDPDFSGVLTSQGYNLIGNNSGVTIVPANQTGDQIGTINSPIDPLLGALKDNGGPTFTHALFFGSPAIDKGSATTGVTTDQRGLSRPVDDPAIPNASDGDGNDIGAFEVQAPTPTPTPTPQGCIDVSVPTGQTALKSETLIVPVNVSDTTGKGIISYDFAFTYDPSVMTPLDTPFDQTGTLGSEFAVTVNGSTPGLLIVSGFGTSALAGSGTLLKLRFKVNGSAPVCSELKLSSFHFNEGNPCAGITNGQMCVISGAISGVVNYGTAAGAAQPVPGVTLSAAGTPSAGASTDTNGAYSFSGLGNGPYTITPNKTPEITGITAFDAALVAQYVVGLITLTPNQQIAADVSNNSTITSFDAALIAQTVVGLPNQSIAGKWTFVPLSRTYPSTITDQPNQNYEAILLGDVSGNWTPPGGQPPLSQSFSSTKTTTIPVALPNKNSPPGASIAIPISVGDLTGLNVISYDFDITFDPTVLQPQSSATNTDGTLSAGMTITANTGAAGHIRIAAFGTTPLSASGTLLVLNFTAVGAPGTSTPLMWQLFSLNEGNPQAATTNGQFSVSSPTAVLAIISGRVTTDTGGPLAGVLMQLSGRQARKTITDGSGTYHFDNVDTNDFYTVSPLLVNYSFNPSNRSFSLVANQTDAIFTAIPETIALGNPLDTPEFFVRQQYVDFLGREPDQAGFEYWTDQISACNEEAGCIRARRIAVSNAFFYEQEYQQTGSYVFRLYRAAFGNHQGFPNPDNTNPTEARKLPSYGVFAEDRSQVVGGSSMARSQLNLANAFVQRLEFANKYPVSLDGPAFVDALLATIQNDISADLILNRQALIDLFDAGGRGSVLYRLADDNAQTNPVNNRVFIDAEYNRAFVFTQYAGYLRRDSDIGGFLFWLGQVNRGPLHDVTTQHAMVCAFVTSAEYQQRFSPVLTHINQECSQ